MLQDLDTTLSNLLTDGAAPAALLAAEVAFTTPEKTFGPVLGDTAVNLFLCEVKENRELRDVAPIHRDVGNIHEQRRPPIRVDCAYLVTAWSKAQTRVVDEHQLLGLTFAWLSRFPVIPARYFAGSLIGQPFPPPTLLAQWDGAKTVGEFWSALGTPPRPFFNLIVTIAIDLDQVIEDSIVTTISTPYHAKDPASAEELIIIGGTVRDSANAPVADAWVRLDPGGRTQVTDAQGRFVFGSLQRGINFSLRARAQGHSTDATRPSIEIPSLSGEYDLQFPP